MNKYISLSHMINDKTPCYGGEKGLSVNFSKLVAKGDGANGSEVKINSHLSTHIDFPYHFDENGKKLEDYTPDFFVFDKIELIELNGIKNSYIIVPDDLNIKNNHCEILLIKTNFEKYRNLATYWKKNPGISPDVAGYLRSKCPHLRAIGFDFISISPFQNRDLGRKAHRAFLCHKRPILLIEDMRLEMLNQHIVLEKLIISPLLIQGLEASPVNIMGVCNGKS